MLLQFAWGFSSKLFGFKCLSPTTTDEHTYCQLKIFNFILAHFECRSVCIKHTHTKVRRNCWKVMEWNSSEFLCFEIFFYSTQSKMLKWKFHVEFQFNPHCIHYKCLPINLFFNKNAHGSLQGLCEAWNWNFLQNVDNSGWVANFINFFYFIIRFCVDDHCINFQFLKSFLSKFK